MERRADMPARAIAAAAPRYAAITAALFLWGAGGALLDDVVLLHAVVSVMAPWVALLLASALLGRPSPAAVFVSTALGSVGGVVGYYAWKDLAGQGLYVPGLVLWTAAALAASALAAMLAVWTRRRPSSTAAFLLAGAGFAVGEAIWLVAPSEWHAATLLAAGADVALALLLLWRADEASRHRLGWLGSGAACFWIVLLSVRTLVA
jgi:hypothetical protein